MCRRRRTTARDNEELTCNPAAVNHGSNGACFVLGFNDNLVFPSFETTYEQLRGCWLRICMTVARS